MSSNKASVKFVGSKLDIKTIILVGILFLFTQVLVFQVDYQIFAYMIGFMLVVSFLSKPVTKGRLATSLLLGLIFVVDKVDLRLSLSDPYLYYGIIHAMFLISLLIINENYLKRIYKLIYAISFWMLLVGLIFHLLSISNIFTTDPISFVQIEGVDKRFVIYPFYSTYEYRGVIDTFRFSSFFNEPSTLGMFSAFILVSEKFALKKRKNLVYLIAGLFSGSLSFVFMSGAYFAVRLMRVKEMRLNLKEGVLPIVLTILVVLFLAADYGEYFTNRLMYSSGSGFEDARVNLFSAQDKMDYISQFSTSEIMWGIDESVVSRYTATIGHVSWVMFVMKNGLVFTLLFVSILFYLGLSRGNRLPFTIVFISTINHRPLIFYGMNIFFLAYNLYVDVQPVKRYDKRKVNGEALHE